MEMIDAAILLVHPDMLESGLKAAKIVGLPTDRVFQFSDIEHDVSAERVRDWRVILAPEQEAKSWSWDPMSQKSKEMIMCANFSSGTTGRPKGVCVSHYSVIANASQVTYARTHNIDQSEQSIHDDKWLAFLPWYHAYAQLFSIVITCKLRILVYVMSQFHLNDYLSFIEKLKITTLQVVPPIITMLQKRSEVTRYELGSVRYLMSAAAPLKSELQNAVSKKLKGAVIAQSWGMTETTCTGLMIPGNMVDDSGSVGYLLPNTQAMLLDENGKEIEGEGTGQLLVKGPQMMMGYWRNEKATKNTLTNDGWLKTGDIAKCEGGKWWIVDRSKELIKVNGLQVAPAEMEAILLEHEDIADAAVVGVTLHGEELPRAYVFLQDASRNSAEVEESIQNFVSRRVAKHKRLKGGIKFVDAIPRLLSGKIQRSVVKGWSKQDAEGLEETIKARL